MYEEQIYKEEKKESEILVIENFNWVVPECCREGWASCPHVPKKQRKAKKNIGL